MKVRVALLPLSLALACGQTSRDENAGFGEGDGGTGIADVGDDDADDDDADDDDADDDDGAASADDDAGPDDDAGADDPDDTDDGPVDDDAGDSGDAGDAGDDTGGSDGDDAGDTGDTAGDDAGDTGPVDDDACGYPLDGPWVEIEYNQAGGSATSPSWTYSSTPGWGQSEWAAQGELWPEVWDVYQNINVGSDPIGVLATVGSSGTWQLMIGLQDLTSYDYASVCVEGRSVSTSASVQYDVYNPLNGCGASATMAHDWSMHAEGSDLGNCFEEGGGVQAVRIETTGGSSALGIKRVRLILHGAVY